MLQVLQLATCLHLDTLVGGVHGHVVGQRWKGAGLDRLLMLLGNTTVPELKALLHHPKTSVFSELLWFANNNAIKPLLPSTGCFKFAEGAFHYFSGHCVRDHSKPHALLADLMMPAA